jgi:hypothetical protein
MEDYFFAPKIYFFCSGSGLVTPQELAGILGRPRREGREWQCLCPAHTDHDPSLSITERDGRLYFVCRAGCTQESVMDALKSRGLWGSGGGDKPQIADTYDYVDEAGHMLFQVVRFVPKDFRQRHPDGIGGWVWNLQGVRRVPYHLDEMTLAAKQPGWRVYIVEGEKDADQLAGRWGLIATTCPMGAGKWNQEYNRYFNNAEVVIIPDNDAVGTAHAVQVATELLPIARTVKILHLAGLPDKGDVSDWLSAGGSEGELEDLVENTQPFDPNADVPLTPPGQPEVKSAGEGDDTPPPPRPWLLGTNFCRGFLSGLTGAGAAGKTSVRLAQFLALALGRGDIVGEHVFKRTKVLLVCLEDDENELRRRIRAACIHHNINRQDLRDWFYYWTPHDLKLIDIDENGHASPGPLADALKRIITKLQIGLVSVDPFVKSHSANENDNVLVDQAASVFLQVAHDCGCACDYVHHFKKGIPVAGDADAGRGASSLANASRILKTLVKMTEAEAKKFDLDSQTRKSLVRLDDAKINMARAEKASWYKLVSVNIGNPTDDYPHGDNVQAVERWYPPKPATAAKSHLVEIFQALRDGPEDGEFYSADPRSTAWAANLIEQIAHIPENDAEQLLNDWVKNAVVREEQHYSPKRKRSIKRLVINEIKAAEILGPLYQNPTQKT